MASKEEMLARIRAALNRSDAIEARALTVVSNPRFEISDFKSEASNDLRSEANLLDQFIAELERAGGRASRVESAVEIKNYIRALIEAEAGAIVAVSDSPLAREAGLREWLLDLNARVVGTLAEFAESELNQSGADENRNPGELIERYKRALIEASIGVTSADYAIADTGTLALVSQHSRNRLSQERQTGAVADEREQHRLISLLPPVHVCLLDSSRVVANLAEFISRARSEFYSSESPPLAMTFITGPSRTADIELTLTTGVHGPRELHVLLCPPGFPTC